MSPLAVGPTIAGAPPHLAPVGEVTAVEEFSATLAAPPVSTLEHVQALARKQGAQVASINTALGVPSLMWARNESTHSDPAAASLEHVATHGALYSLSLDAQAAARVERIHDTGRGAIVASIEQQVSGIPVYGVAMKVVMDRDRTLVAISGSLHPAATPTALLPKLAMSPKAAVTTAINDIAAGSVRVLTERVSIVLYPHVESLEMAQLVELEVAEANSSDSRAFIYVIADDGRILERLNRTFGESFRYRVWADATAPFRPADGPQGDWSPHQTGVPVDLETTFVAPTLVEAESFNTNPEGGSDPWLADSATTTSGNNVNAYADHAAPDGLGNGDTQADVTASRTFDYVFDPNRGPFVTVEQIKASVVQIFFTINWLHDYYYGFNENARVAQNDNFGRGPGEGDALLAEAQDSRGEQRNNANMSTLGDGISPRMQMYVWNGPVEFIGQTTLTIASPAGIAGDYTAQGSSFGIDSEVTGSGALTLADPANGCAALNNNVNGQIVLIDRGECPFVEKAQNAVAAGADGVVIVNNVGTNALPPLGGDENTITVPVVGISSLDGQTIKDALALGAVSGSANRAGRVRGEDRDGTIDNAIVAHEWGHYFHHRLSFCGGTRQCGAMSEGWGDFMSVQLVVREGDDLDGVYGVPSFVSSDPYFGIRRVPYSRPFDRNALTFKHLGENATLPSEEHPMQVFGANNEVHNAGEVWTTMLTEAYLAMLDDSRHTFDAAQRRFSDYIVGGLLASPPNGTITEIRDSILAVAAASDREDMVVIAEAFARRGAGTGAQSPPRDSDTLDEVVESFDIAGEISVAAVSLPGDVDCDQDGNWDASETALLRIEIANAGPLGLSGTEVEVSSTNPAVSFPNGTTTTIADLAGFDRGVAEINVTLAEDVEDPSSVSFAVVAKNGGSLTAEVTADLSRRVNLDDIPASSADDDVESRVVVWDQATNIDTINWTRSQDSASRNTVWKVVDASTTTDLRLESPDLVVGTTDLTIEFEHRYSFEQSDGTSWDGGVIEVSTDGGATWNDVGAAAGYDGVLTSEAGNPLSGREAYSGQSPGYPSMSTKTLALGTQFASSSIRIRFRVGTDAAAGDEGWEIDNLKITGITNTPFATIGNDTGSCDGIIDLPGGDDDGGGCGCQGGGGSGTGAILLIALAFGVLRRKRR